MKKKETVGTQVIKLFKGGREFRVERLGSRARRNTENRHCEEASWADEAVYACVYPKSIGCHAPHIDGARKTKKIMNREQFHKKQDDATNEGCESAEMPLSMAFHASSHLRTYAYKFYLQMRLSDFPA